MSKLVIDDLEENQEMDAAAMQAVFGGRSGYQSSLPSGAQAHRSAAQFDQSSLVSGLILVNDLRSS